MAAGSPRDRFKILNDILGRTKVSSINAIETAKNQITTDQTEIASELNEYFSTVGEEFSKTASSTIPDHIPRAFVESSDKFNFAKPSQQCVFRHMKNLNPSKPAGPDNIAPKVIKEMSSIF